MPVVLLASYPKSGSTWLRALLSNYLAEGDEPVSINALVNLNIHSRLAFDELLGVSSSVMTEDEILRLRPGFQESLAMEADSPAFAKTHEPSLLLPDGAPLFAQPCFAGAIHIVRNPLDIAVSYAHHLQCDVDRSIRVMRNPEAMLSDQRLGIHPGLPHRVSDWSRNVSSWLDQDALPTMVVRYEAMHADPDGVLVEVIAFCGLSQDPTRRARAIENSRFHRLREQEGLEGFNERQPTAPSFFRRGRVGDWRGILSGDQVNSLVKRHGPVMARVGYLDNADGFEQATNAPPPRARGKRGQAR